MTLVHCFPTAIFRSNFSGPDVVSIARPARNGAASPNAAVATSYDAHETAKRRGDTDGLPAVRSSVLVGLDRMASMVHCPRMDRTVFHKILDREIPANVVYEDDDVLAFKDIRPQATTHLLFIPKTFVASIADIDEATERIPGHLVVTAKRFAQEKGITGYKLSFNVGKDGGQEVPYIHLHFLSPQALPEE